MKKSVLYIVVVFALLLTACTKENVSQEPEAEIIEAEGTEVLEEEEVEVEPLEEDSEVLAEKNPDPLYELNAVWGFDPIEDADPKVVLLTIDDAPDKRSLEMAKKLKDLDAPAIFFVNGHFIETEEKQAILKEIHEMGFTIGNHTKTHANLKQSSEEQQKEEILFVSDTVEKVIGERPKFFRAPFGVNTEFSRAIVQEEGMLLMNWTYGYDWEKKYMDANALADIMVNTEYLRDGANLLMHDREWTAEALEGIVNGLRDKGYDFIDPSTIKVVSN
ncbi:polysaccharide deacetylase family protein [Sporosarcina sp. CAU 1771]